MKCSELLVFVTFVITLFIGVLVYELIDQEPQHGLTSVSVGACGGGSITENVDYCERSRKNCMGEYKDASGKALVSGTTGEGGASIGFDWSTAKLVACPGTYDTACFIESGSKVEGTESTQTTNQKPCSNTFKQGNCRMPYWGSTCVEQFSSATPKCTGDWRKKCRRNKTWLLIFKNSQIF
ncbi:MAG: hypothetical protein LBE13_09985 [Bacteroidales bacterium]|jgi:hypothetical protein|nr:hypothetical protein [Bacteroidales bacterium]